MSSFLDSLWRRQLPDGGLYRRTHLIPPTEVRHWAVFLGWTVPKDRASVVDGDWDLDLPDLLSHPRFQPHYVGLSELLAGDGEPARTAYCRALAADRKLRNAGLGSADQEVENYARLCRDIRERGYLSQDRLADWTPEWFRRIKRRRACEVEVGIGRAGEYVFLTGKHRLAIALHLGVLKIPVQVRVRHLRWVETRNAFLRPGSPESGDVRLARHPDLEDATPIKVDPASVLTVGRCPEDTA